jgi:hypothetical protein
LEASKKLLFVHDSLPAEGISGMIVFLRHFKRLESWEIHILIPENAYRADIVETYPKNFIVHTFKLRKSWWPPFRENNPLLVRSRLFLMEKELTKFVDNIQPQLIISVLFHYYSVVMSRISKLTGIPLVLFLHDLWDIKHHDSNIQNLRKGYAKETILNSSYMLPVTDDLVNYYLDKPISNYEVLLPIPEGFIPAAKPEKNKNIVYAGTIEQHHLNLFKDVLDVLEVNGYRLTVITNEPKKLFQLLENHPNLVVKKSFETNREALSYIAETATAILVNYGTNKIINPFAMHSFPSKFVEFSHLGLPIITLSPTGSPFYNFLEANNYPLMIKGDLKEELNHTLVNLSDENLYKQYCKACNDLAINQFNPTKIHSQFEAVLLNMLPK